MTNTKQKFFHLNSKNQLVCAVESESGCMSEQLELARAWNRNETRPGMTVELVSSHREARLALRLAAV